MKINKIITLFTIVLLLLSCSNESNLEFENTEAIEDTNLKTFVEYLNLYSQQTEPGSILIQTNNVISDRDKPSKVYISEKPSDSKENNIELINTKNRHSYSKENKGGMSSKSDYQDIFGSVITYTENSEIGKSATGATGESASQTMYVPTVVNLDINTPTAKAGSVITWNVDPQNTEGIVLYATYHPVSQSDLTIAEKNQDRIVRGIVLPDNAGSYTLKASDLERFPDNSHVDITVARGVISATPSNRTVAAITKTTTSLRIDR